MHAIADDLFAGVGGWDLAAGTLGVQARGVEIDAAARATRDAAGLVTVHDDVWTYQPDDQAQGLIASPPCQTFSKAGKGVGRRGLVNVTQALATDAYTSRDELRELGKVVGDERTALVLLPMHFATQHGHYRWMAWEQTALVLPVWEACAAILRELGWRVWTGNLRAEQYGVPQTRTRAVLLACQDGDALPPLPTCSRYYSTDPDRLDDGLAPWVSMAEALPQYQDSLVGFPRRLDPGQEGVTLDGVAYRARDLRHTSRPSFAVTSKGRSWQAWPAYMGDVVTTRGTVRHVLEPAPTLTASMDNGNYRRVGSDWPAEQTRAYTPERLARFAAPADPGTPRQAGRRVSVAEAGVLQGFPATFPWQGTRTAQFAQVGNAIPPPMAAAALAQVCPQATGHTNADEAAEAARTRKAAR